MRFERLTASGSELFDKAMELYAISFPFHEQRLRESQEKIMGNAEYHFDLLFDGDKFSGIILRWETERFIYVEHFCIFPELRNRKYGQQALEMLSSAGKTVILEIDPPEDELSKRRKAFYERLGYKANAFEHIHPPYHEDLSGHSLVVMSSPELLSESDYNRFACYLKDTVMNHN